MTKNICIYHAGCADGFAAALAVWKKFGDSYEYLPANYGDAAPDVTGKDVIIVDFSYPRAELEYVHSVAKSLLVIDHHKTAQEALQGLDYCVFDMTKSGAVLTWEHFFPSEVLPTLFRYVQDRDLWQWSLDNSKAVSAGISLQDKRFSLWHILLDEDSFYYDMVTVGSVVLKYQQKCAEDACSVGAGTIELGGHTVPCVNTTHLVSEIVGTLAEDAPFAVGYFDTNDRRVFSLRSRDGGLDVSEIAKKYGGGGHASAAGFWIPLPPIFPQGG